MTPAKNYLTLDELKSEFRDFKLRVLNDEVKFKLVNDIDDETSDKLKFIQSTFPNDILTGSLALKILGLLSRKNGDIDILISDKSRYKGYVLDGYDDEFSSKNRLGFIQFNWKSGFFSKTKVFDIDFFETNTTNYLSFDFRGKELKIHNPLELMQHKLDIITSPKVEISTARKHNEDLTQIFGQSVWKLAIKGDFEF